MKLFFILLLLPVLVLAQTVEQFELNLLSPSSEISTNTIVNTFYNGSYLFFGNRGNGLGQCDGYMFNSISTGFVLLDHRSVYSVSGDGQRLFFATGESQTVEGRRIATGVKYGIQLNQNADWIQLDLPLDYPTDDFIFFGQDTILTLPVIVPQQFVTYDSAIHGDTIWVATWSGGIRWTKNLGQTWERVLLPPDRYSFISPDSSYKFVYSPVYRSNLGGGGDLNFLGFSVHKTHNGSVWAGTAGGINFRYGSNAWKKFKHGNSIQSLPGNWVTGIKSQNINGQDRVWAICWRATESTEQFGLAFTDNNGQTWNRTLLGEKIYDVSFNGDTILAVGVNGIFYSKDASTWFSQSSFIDQQSKRMIFNKQFYSTEFLSHVGRWMIGSEDGLLTSNSPDIFSELNWNIFQTNPRSNTDEVFAYPNPFSPDDDEYCRFSFPSSTTVSVKIFSFDQILVTELKPYFHGPVSEIIWNGKDAFGRRLANGVYYFIISGSFGEKWGKLLILE